MLKQLKQFEVMLNIFEFSWMWENVESWLVYANNLFWIAQPYFSTDIMKQSWSSLIYNTSARHEQHECNISATQ